jgi:hypothetical protein
LGREPGPPDPSRRRTRSSVTSDRDGLGVDMTIQPSPAAVADDLDSDLARIAECQ